MQVLIDGNPGFEVSGAPRDVLSIAVAAITFVMEQGRDVIELIVDDDRVSPEEMNGLLDGRPVESCARLALRTVPSGNAKLARLAGIEEAVHTLPEFCRTLAQMFQSDAPHDGLMFFSELADAWLKVKTCQLQIARDMSINLDGIVLDGIPFITHHNELNLYLNEAVEAMQQGDYVLLGDLLEYELAPRADLEGEILSVLQELASDSGQPERG